MATTVVVDTAPVVPVAADLVAAVDLPLAVAVVAEPRLVAAAEATLVVVAAATGNKSLPDHSAIARLMIRDLETQEFMDGV